ncbi:homeobox protein not2-like [Belonocnema kinseyi]|uniref:homeobox protein not2-like n=1 Tax=Belonocnema kinseyi TaxID=2817044 RepID=UPI00143D0219|nr:homeobox protein not2-like [Belonocnema kinseyi]
MQDDVFAQLDLIIFRNWCTNWTFEELQLMQQVDLAVKEIVARERLASAIRKNEFKKVDAEEVFYKKIQDCQRKEEKKRKIRSVFTPEQLNMLENEFISYQSLEKNRVFGLSKTLNLSEKQIRTWFSNRRNKERKMGQKSNRRNVLEGNFDKSEPNQYPQNHQDSIEHQKYQNPVEYLTPYS